MNIMRRKEPMAAFSPSAFLFFFCLYYFVFSSLASASAAGLLTAESRVHSASAQEIEAARKLVKDARAKAAVFNENRLAHPFRVHSWTRRTHSKRQLVNADTAPPALFPVSEEVARAAALLTEIDAANSTTGEPLHKRAGSWWMGNKQHRGSWPWGDDPSYQVFRDVTDAKWATGGAARCVADGKTDCTEAINNAMKAGKRCGEKCNGSTTKQAIIYFPPGKYLISSTIEIFFGTQMIGDAVDRPTIIASANFVGLGIFSVDHYVENGGLGPDGGAKQWYINTANFYRQIRNFVFDTRKVADIPTGDGSSGFPMCAIHYQVGQATSLTNLKFIMSGDQQRGVFAENGSGGHMSDLHFLGGGFGIWGGAQQFTTQRVVFDYVNVPVQLIWDWGWSWKSVSVRGGTTAFKLISADGTGEHNTGSILIMDSAFRDVGTVVEVFPVSSELKTGTTGIVLENVLFTSVGQGVVDTTGKSYLSGGSQSIKSWILGPAYLTEGSSRTFEIGHNLDITRDEGLLSSENEFGLPLNPYFERPKPQYTDVPWSEFVSVKSAGAKGDGVTDDSKVLQAIINTAAKGNKIVFFDAGTYILKFGLLIPSGSRIVGEAWAQLVATGPKFEDPYSTLPLIQVGSLGHSPGSVEIQDLLLTTKGPAAGATLTTWMLNPEKQGSIGMWDTHVRVGGATGTDLESKECPPSASADGTKCMGANMMMHISPYGSAYLENVWLWTADHDIDDPLLEDDSNGMVQCSIYVRRGLLVESTQPTWLYGTSSEHAIMYQYNFHAAKSVFATMIQTESPYYQPSPKPYEQFEKNLLKHAGDETYSDCPDGPGCDASWAVMITDSQSIYLAGAGLYSWFSSYDQTVCVDASNCQKALIRIRDSIGVQINNLVTIGATTMINMEEDTVESADNLAVGFHPFWSHITAWGAGETADPDDGWVQLGDPVDPCTDNYDTLEALDAAGDKIPEHCRAEYTLKTLQNVYDSSMSGFRDLVNNGYDEKFGYYADAFVKSAGRTVSNFTNNVGKDYFTCEVGEFSYCCSDCKSVGCKYCFEGSCYETCNHLSCWDTPPLLLRGVDRRQVHQRLKLKRVKVREPCPPDYSQRGAGPTNPYAQSVWWTIQPGKKDSFLNALNNATGIPLDKISFVAKHNRGNNCAPSSSADDGCWYTGIDYNFPQPSGYTKSDVINPKETVQEALYKAADLDEGLRGALFAVQMAAYDGDVYELIDAVSLPILTINAAIESMQEISKSGQEIKDEKRKATIILFVSAVCMIVPIAGQVIGSAAGLTGLGTALTILGAAGGVALDIYSVVDSKGNDPLAIFGLVLAPLAIRDIAVVSKAARIRRGMGAEQMAKMGPKVAKRMNIVSRISNVCRRR
ncbi:hypothetical protein TWF696_007988 [Orbilia brochopaga]|uniref:Rhamnogalacturonase A/B/Epimerase-like pectate lyase domain-containing protein n=1 Tax=Orbilia brochopaga TaxID=3140254 RepID=A0AAV9UMW7_9PEZI